ncbi:hypothetical protein [Achromobacter anxifer]|uniref:hypothetical protein n=1 Tax=Achromobacter anxifer TaxID=1287737 RepID=UPI0023F81C44|nr:hypothetical protein [Achromobacter anxifer]MDF8364717.1 hypothetical protein [Achromobacter anxifer]
MLPATSATSAGTTLAPLYVIQRMDTAPFLQVQELVPKSEEERRQHLMSRNPASQSKEEAEQRLANCFAARANAALAEAQTYLDALNQSPAQATTPIQSIRLTAVPLGGEGGNPANYTAEIQTPDSEEDQQLIGVTFLGPDGCAAAFVLAGLSHDGEPCVLVTTDGLGEGDPNVEVYPLRRSEDAVIVDHHNSRLNRAPTAVNR